MTRLVELCKAQWLLYVRHSTVLLSAHTAVFMCFVWISEQTAMSLYSINCLVFITEKECVFCAIRTEPLYIIQVNLRVDQVFLRQGFSPITSLFPCQNRSTNAPYSSSSACCSKQKVQTGQAWEPFKSGDLREIGGIE